MNIQNDEEPIYQKMSDRFLTHTRELYPRLTNCKGSFNIENKEQNGVMVTLTFKGEYRTNAVKINPVNEKY